MTGNSWNNIGSKNLKVNFQHVLQTLKLSKTYLWTKGWWHLMTGLVFTMTTGSCWDRGFFPLMIYRYKQFPWSFFFGTHWNPSQPRQSQHTSHMMGCYRSGWVSSHSLENGGELSNVPSHALLQYRPQGCLQLSSKLCSPHSLFIESPPSWSDLHSRRPGRFHAQYKRW